MSEYQFLDERAHRDPDAEVSDLEEFPARFDGDEIVTDDGLRAVVTVGWDRYAAESYGGCVDHYVDDVFTDPEEQWPSPQRLYVPWLEITSRSRFRSRTFFEYRGERQVVDFIRRSFEREDKAGQYHRLCDRGLGCVSVDVFRGGELLARRELGGVDPARWRTLLAKSEIIDLAFEDAREEIERRH